jgi:hypothetical protein
MPGAKKRAEQLGVRNVMVATNSGASVLATPKLGSPHAAMVLRPAKTRDLFSMRLRVKDLLLVPTGDDVWFSDGPLP